MRGFFSARGIRFFCGGEENVIGKHAQKSYRGGGDLGETRTEHVFFKWVQLSHSKGFAALRHAIQGQAGFSRKGVEIEFLQGRAKQESHVRRGSEGADDELSTRTKHTEEFS